MAEFTRRTLLKGAAALGAAAMLGGCAPQTLENDELSKTGSEEAAEPVIEVKHAWCKTVSYTPLSKRPMVISVNKNKYAKNSRHTQTSTTALSKRGVVGTNESTNAPLNVPTSKPAVQAAHPMPNVNRGESP